MDIGTNKENMVALKWPRFSDSHWRAGEDGEKQLCSGEGSLTGFCVGWGMAGLLGLGFPSNWKPSLPPWIMLERNVQNEHGGRFLLWGQPAVGPGYLAEWGPVPAPLEVRGGDRLGESPCT